jgi:hypothetical protein
MRPGRTRAPSRATCELSLRLARNSPSSMPTRRGNSRFTGERASSGAPNDITTLRRSKPSRHYRWPRSPPTIVRFLCGLSCRSFPALSKSSRLGASSTRRRGSHGSSKTRAVRDCSPEWVLDPIERGDLPIRDPGIAAAYGQRRVSSHPIPGWGAQRETARSAPPNRAAFAWPISRIVRPIACGWVGDMGK